MQFNPSIPSLPTLKPPSAITPTVQMALSPAVQAAQQIAPPVRTQTVSAPQATGKAEQPRDTRSATQNGTSLDTNAAALAAQVNGQGYGGTKRGSLLDVSV